MKYFILTITMLFFAQAQAQTALTSTGMQRELPPRNCQIMDMVMIDVNVNQTWNHTLYAQAHFRLLCWDLSGQNGYYYIHSYVGAPLEDTVYSDEDLVWMVDDFPIAQPGRRWWQAHLLSGLFFEGEFEYNRFSYQWAASLFSN